MNCKRHRKEKILLCTAVSFLLLFTLLSCGEPTFCTLNNISIIHRSGSDIVFSVSGEDTDLSLLSEGPGLLVFYILSNDDYGGSMSSSIYNGIRNRFKSQLNETPRLFISDDSPVVTYTDSDGKVYSLYAFTNSGNKAVSPYYNFNLGVYVSGTALNTGDIEITSNGDGTFSLACSKGTAELKASEYSTDVSTHIVLLAAFSAEVGSFSNNYWSDLVYIGETDITASST